MKKQYDHVSSCIKDFHSKLYPKKRSKSKVKEHPNKSARGDDVKTNDSNDDVVEIVMQVDPMMSSP